MLRLKALLNLAAVIIMGMVATTSVAEARHYQHVDDSVVGEASCAPPPPTAMYIYPAANWEPFFRRHLYRYGPILSCEPSVATTNVISVRY
jgi:hypothetical protein